LFEDDPPEYIRKVHSPLEDWLDPRIAASNLLQMLGRYRLKDTLPRFMTQLQKMMDEYARAPDSMKDHRMKEAAIYTFATLSTILQEKKPYCNQLEAQMKKYIIPELQVSLLWWR
jgi:3-deoxy-D-arabino-heptulosonate 7-phosphate (DAHP) synthase class II